MLGESLIRNERLNASGKNLLPGLRCCTLSPHTAAAAHPELPQTPRDGRHAAATSHPTATTAHHGVSTAPRPPPARTPTRPAPHGTAAACVRGATTGRRGISWSRRTRGFFYSLVRITTSFLAIRSHLNREAGSTNAHRVLLRHPTAHVFLLVPHTAENGPSLRQWRKAARRP